jgi:tetratricopeptide (TPR) repeat protein
MADRQKAIQSAEKLVSKGRIQAAIDQYHRVLDRHPNDTSTLNRVGDLHVRLNRMPKAIELFKQTAESFGRQGFFVKAIAIYKKIIRLDPAQIGAYEALADLYNRQGLTGDSLAQYQVVADFYRKHGDSEAAIGVYRSMVEIEPNNPTRRLQLAGLLQGEGRTSKALDQYYEIARLMLEHSRGDDALRVLSEGVAIDPQNLDFVRKAMQALQDGGFDRLATTLLEKAIEDNPEANALRLDPLPSEPAAESPDPSPAAAVAEESDAGPAPATPAEAPVETPSELAEPALEEVEEPAEVVEEAIEEATEEVTEEATGGAEAVVEESAEAPEPATGKGGAADFEDSIELDLGEIDLVELEELQPSESLDPVAPATGGSSAPPEAVELEVTEDSVAFELDLDEPAETIAKQPEEPDELAEPEQAAMAGSEVSGESIKLLIEAEVLVRYGMDEMAVPVLERILRAEPEHGEAMGRLVQSKLRLGRDAEALDLANRMADIVESDAEPPSWSEVCASMAETGFTLSDGRFVGEPAARPVAPDEPAAESPEPAIELSEEPAHSLEEIVAEATADVAPRAKRPPEAPDDDVLGEVMEEIEREVGKAPAPEAELDAGLREEIARPEPAAEGPIEPPAEPAEELADELASDEFVDLATELEAELLDEDGLDDELIPSLREQSLEDIVEGFRQGMAETLSDSDFDTHYNLGVAYQEMGLIDEAIGEFQLAAKDDRYLVDCSSLLASCFVEKDLPDLAIQWFVRGIDSPAIDPESKLGLLYELASLLDKVGEPEAARARFLEIYGVNSNYRDVATKLETLPA